MRVRRETWVWVAVWLVLAVLVVAGRGRGWQTDVLIVVAWAGGVASAQLASAARGHRRV